MKIQKVVNRLQKLHPKEIDLSLSRIKKLLKKLGNPQNKIKAISVVGTNGKNSTIEALYSILLTFTTGQLRFGPSSFLAILFQIGASFSLDALFNSSIVLTNSELLFLEICFFVIVFLKVRLAARLCRI